MCPSIMVHSARILEAFTSETHQHKRLIFFFPLIGMTDKYTGSGRSGYRGQCKTRGLRRGLQRTRSAFRKLML